jgi:hypothetical protein
MSDGFDGTTLGAQWSVQAGATPTTYDVSASRLFIADAPFASTPSSPSNSWIYDLDFDKGNQIAWAHAIGGQDFTLTADLGWSSTNTEITLGGVGVTDAQGKLAAINGMSDGSSGMSGVPFSLILVPAGMDIAASGPVEEPGSAIVRIQRINGTAKVYVDNIEVATGAMPTLISSIVIYYVRHQNGAMQYTYGSFEVRSIELCRP